MWVGAPDLGADRIVASWTKLVRKSICLYVVVVAVVLHGRLYKLSALGYHIVTR